MLVLLREPGQSVEIEGGIKITVDTVRGNKVKLLFDVPKSLYCHRSEVLAAIKQEQRTNEMHAARTGGKVSP